MINLNNNGNLKTEYRKGGTPMKVKTMINRYHAKDKENAGSKVGLIKNNDREAFKSDIVEVTVDELAQAVLNGQTIIPAILEGKLIESNFKEQSVFFIDIDDINCSLQELINRFKDFPIALIYTTFSHTKQNPRYRFVFIADKAIKDKETARKVNMALMSIAGCADTKCKDVSRVFYAGKSIVHKANVKIDVNKLLKNVSIEDIPAAPKTIKKAPQKVDKSIDGKSIGADEIKANITKIRADFKGVKEIDYIDSFNWFNKNVKLTDVLDVDLNTKFRCLLDSHVDEHPSASICENEGQQYYRCSCSEFESPKSLIDTLHLLLNMDKLQVMYMLAKELRIKLGSDYQRQAREHIVNIKMHMYDLIEPGTELYKAMKYLWGAYQCILDFALTKVTAKPLSKDPDNITFFMSSSQLMTEMELRDIKGASQARNKISQLCEYGLIRSLSDEEIDSKALKRAREEQKKLQEKGLVVPKRVNFYTLCDFTPEMLEKAETIIKTRKTSGAKRRGESIERLALTHGVAKAEEMYVQSNVQDKIKDKKYLKKEKKIRDIIDNLLEEQGYFNQEQIYKVYNKSRNYKRVEAIEMIEDVIPAVVQEKGLKKDRVKKSTRKQFKIRSEFKINSIIFY